MDGATHEHVKQLENISIIHLFVFGPTTFYSGLQLFEVAGPAGLYDYRPKGEH